MFFIGAVNNLNINYSQQLKNKHTTGSVLVEEMKWATLFAIFKNTCLIHFKNKLVRFFLIETIQSTWGIRFWDIHI